MVQASASAQTRLPRLSSSAPSTTPCHHPLMISSSSSSSFVLFRDVLSTLAVGPAEEGAGSNPILLRPPSRDPSDCWACVTSLSIGLKTRAWRSGKVLCVQLRILAVNSSIYETARECGNRGIALSSCSLSRSHGKRATWDGLTSLTPRPLPIPTTITAVPPSTNAVAIENALSANQGEISSPSPSASTWAALRSCSGSRGNPWASSSSEYGSAGVKEK